MILTSHEQSVLIRFGETTCQKGKAQWCEVGTCVTKQSLYCCFMFTLAQSYCIQFSNALVLRYTYRRMRMRKCGVTMWCVVNRITGPRAAVHAHTPKSCTYNRATRRVRGTVHWKTLSLASTSSCMSQIELEAKLKVLSKASDRMCK